MGLRYGLLAVLTLVIASALLWDRSHPPETNRLVTREEPAREDLAVVVLGGKPEPLPPPPASASLPAGAGAAVLSADDGGTTAADPGPDGPYVVEKGDTLGQIALKTMGSSRKAAELAKFNGFDVDTPLKVGQEIRVPPRAPGGAAPAPVAAREPARAGTTVAAAAPAEPAPKAAKRSHTVGKGDTLFSLAKRYYGDGGKFRELAESNGLDPDEPLKLGSELRLP